MRMVINRASESAGSQRCWPWRHFSEPHFLHPEDELRRAYAPCYLLSFIVCRAPPPCVRRSPPPRVHRVPPPRVHRVPPPCVRRVPPQLYRKSRSSSLCALCSSALSYVMLLLPMCVVLLPCALCALLWPCICFSYTLNSVLSQTSGRLSPPFFPPCSLNSNIPLSHTVIPSLARQSQGASPPNSGLRFHSELLSSQNLLLFETILFTHWFGAHSVSIFLPPYLKVYPISRLFFFPALFFLLILKV